MLLWTNPLWKGHLPVCPVSVECEVCTAARKAMAEQVRVPPHESVWGRRQPLGASR